MDFYFQDQQGYASRPNQWSGCNQGASFSSIAQSRFGNQVGNQMDREPSFKERLITQLEEMRADMKTIGKKSFKAMVTRKLDALQTQRDGMTQKDEEEEKRNFFEAEVMDRLDMLQANMEESIVKRFEKCLEAYEGRISKKLEEHSSKTTHMYEKLLHKKFEDLQDEIKAVNCWVIRLENRMEREMGQLYCGMYKAQGRFDKNDIEDDNASRPLPLEELLDYNGESIQEDLRNEGVEKRCESISPMPCAYNENERMLCEDIASLRGGGLANEDIHGHSMDIEGMREGEYMACPPVDEIEYSIGAEVPLHQEDSSLSPRIIPCYSCEIACDPQVKACFEALASSSLKEESYEDLSWEEKGPMVDFEVQKRKCKKKGQVVAQVWIPRGTLEVMNVFHMREINLGKKSWVPHKAKKRKRRKTPSKPQSESG